MILPPYLTRASAPSGSSQSSSSVSYDYSGMDDRAKKIDALQQLRPAKYQALYSGDVAGSASIEQRIRDLLGAINNPQVPLVRVSSAQSSTSNSGNGGEVEGYHDVDTDAPEMDADAPDPASALAQVHGRPNRRNPLATALKEDPNRAQYISTAG